MLADESFVLIVVRGDHRVNEIKLRLALGSDFRPARADEIEQRLGPPGFIGPVGAQMRIVLDEAVRTDAGGYVVGANRPDEHLRGVVPGRDFVYESADVRSVVVGDTVGGHPVRIEPAIEVGNIFKLGTRYSDVLGASYLDQAGASQMLWMGCYGIGPARIAAAAIEQFADDRGISWPRAIAPFDVHLVTLGKPGSDERALSDRLYDELQEAGLDSDLRRARRRPRREVRRRRVARLPAARHGRTPDAAGWGTRGSGAQGAGGPRPPAGGRGTGDR